MAGTSNYPPYEPNALGFTEALIDLKDTLAGRTVYSVAGFETHKWKKIWLSFYSYQMPIR